MSIEVYKSVWQNSKQTGGLKLTLLALADYCGQDNGYKCWPSIPTLATMVGTSERQIKRNLAQLEESGELVVLRNVGRANTNLYDLSPLKGDTHDTISVKEKVTSKTEKVTSRVIKGDTHVTQTVRTVKEPSLQANGNGAVFSLYEQEIGMMSKIISDQIVDAVDEFGAGFVEEAIGIAVKNNIRKWSYVDGVLQRWRANGKQDNRKNVEKVERQEGGGLYV